LFLTSRQLDSIIGGFKIRDRRRKPDEPFNPFAANANQVRQKKRSERTQTNDARPAPQNRPQVRNSSDSNELRKKQEEARKRLGGQAVAASPSIQKPAIESSALNAPTSPETAQQVSRADRLAELRKQSQESVKKTESILEPAAPAPVQPAQVEVQPETTVSDETPSTIETDTQSIDNRVVAENVVSSKNVFKQIVTETPKKREHRRRRSRHDDSGGGRQPKVKKLNRQRYNDYKYAARDILDDDSVADEHRSNLLGQIWAKGERIGVDATYEFITEKEEQLIINENVAQRLKDLVKALTTRR